MPDDTKPIDERPLQRGALVPKGSAAPREIATTEQLINSPALALWFDDRLFDRARTMAVYLSKAEGMVPRHLLGKMEACFAVVSRSLTWKLDPYAVAACTYQTPGGAVGFEGKLIQAVLENSGKLVGGLVYEHYGDWSKVKGKWILAKSQKGNDYPKATWTRDDAKGLGVIISAQVAGEVERRTLRFDLEDCFPLNSTLWATRPAQQICYTGARAFGNMAMPGILMGVPFEDDLPTMRDVTPGEDTPARPTRADIVSGRAAPLAVEDMWTFVNEDGQEIGCRGTTQFEELLADALKHAPNVEVASGIMEANAATLNQIRAIPGAAEAVERIGEAVAAAQTRFNAAPDVATVTKDSEAARAGAAAPEGRPAGEAEAGPTGAANATTIPSTDPAVAGAGANTPERDGQARVASSPAPDGDGKTVGPQAAIPPTTGATGPSPESAGEGGGSKFDSTAVYESLYEGLVDQRSEPDIAEYLKLWQGQMLALRDHDKKMAARLDKKVAEHREKVKRK